MHFQRVFWWAGARSELVPLYIVASQTVEESQVRGVSTTGFHFLTTRQLAILS